MIHVPKIVVGLAVVSGLLFIATVHRLVNSLFLEMYCPFSHGEDLVAKRRQLSVRSVCMHVKLDTGEGKNYKVVEDETRL